MSIGSQLVKGSTFREIRHEDPTDPARRQEILESPGFGRHFTDHMVTMVWTDQEGWHDGRIEPYGPFRLDPAAAVLHYGQEIFEGLKAYRHPDGSIWGFRPGANAHRFNRSARRMALPEFPVEDFLSAVELLVAKDWRWVPDGDEQSLYLRPLMFAEESFLGVRPARRVRFCVIASPVGAYFPKGIEPVSIWLSTNYTRAARGGTGAAKCGGNYAAGLAAQQEASAHGCDQVCFLDAADQRWVEELGGMNLFFVHEDGTLVTPELTGTILEGITRSSILDLAKEQGLEVVERRVDVDEWRRGMTDGRIREVFACGTAAVITPVGRLVWEGGEATVPLGTSAGPQGTVWGRLRSALIDIQWGRTADTHGWMRRFC
jgi:branched-chain amino acid aminotransferase